MSVTTRIVPRITQYAAVGGYRSFARVWSVPNPIGRVVFLHGIISHGGWYLDSCRMLAEAGIETHFLERRGSGLNDRSRGDVDDYRTWIRDVEIYLQRLGSSLPRILLGISWGGKLALAVTKSSPALVDAIGMLCPGLYAPRGPSGFQKKLLAIVARTPLQKKTVTIPLQDPALFTDNPAWQRYIAEDPLVLRSVTLRFAFADVQLDRYVSDAAFHVSKPTLLMLAGKDRITANDRLRKFAQQLASTSKEVIEYADATHTLEFEADPEPYFRDLVGWVRAQTGSATRDIRHQHPR